MHLQVCPVAYFEAWIVKVLCFIEAYFLCWKSGGICILSKLRHLSFLFLPKLTKISTTPKKCQKIKPSEAIGLL